MGVVGDSVGSIAGFGESRIGNWLRGSGIFSDMILSGPSGRLSM